jgi:hypothetical protein
MTTSEDPSISVVEQLSNDRPDEGRDDSVDLTEPQELTTKQDGDVQGQSSASGHTSKAHHVVKTCSVSTLDDTSTNEDTSLTQQNVHGTPDNVRTSPKKIKKLKLRGRLTSSLNRLATYQGAQHIKVENHNRTPRFFPTPYHPFPPCFIHVLRLMFVITLATLNINGITARTRVGMLADFLRQHIDILFMQEVTSMEALNIPGYAAHHNIGASSRGTAIT